MQGCGSERRMGAGPGGRRVGPGPSRESGPGGDPHDRGPQDRSQPALRPRGDRRVRRRRGRTHLRHGPGRRGGDEPLSRRPARLVPQRLRATDRRRAPSSPRGPAATSATPGSGWSSRPSAACSTVDDAEPRPSAATRCPPATAEVLTDEASLATSALRPDVRRSRPRSCPRSSTPTAPAAASSWERARRRRARVPGRHEPPVVRARARGRAGGVPELHDGARPAGCPDRRRRLRRRLVDDRAGPCLPGGHASTGSTSTQPSVDMARRQRRRRPESRTGSASSSRCRRVR